MTYIRKKTIRKANGAGERYTYYQVVRGYREDGKVKQEVVAHLGKHDSVEKAIEELEHWAAAYQKHADNYFHAAEYIRQQGPVARFYGRPRRLVPRKDTPLDTPPPQDGGLFAPQGWFYAPYTEGETAEQGWQYQEKAWELEAKADRLRSLL